MTVTEKIEKAIETLHNEYEGAELTRAELKKVSIVSTYILIRHKAIQTVIHEHFIPVSVTELVRVLNDCANSGYYNCDWEYVEIDGEAFRVVRTKTYKIL